MNWTRHKLEKYFDRIKQELIRQKSSKPCYKEFNAKFPKLFSSREFSFLCRNPIRIFTCDLFFCKICGKPVKYDGRSYSHICNNCNTSFISKQNILVKKHRNTLTKDYIESILPNLKRYLHRINKQIITVRLPISIYCDFNSIYPCLFTSAELNYLRNLPLSKLTCDLFFCRNCGKPINFSGYTYPDFCSTTCKRNFKANLCNRIKEQRLSLTKDCIKSILPNIRSFIRHINKNGVTKVLSSSDYYSFNSKYPYLFTFSELSYLRKLPISKINVDLFFCKICGKPVSFNESGCYFSACCSPQCAYKLQYQTNKRRYGGNPMKDPVVVAKVSKTVKDRYGVDNYFKLEQFKQKMAEDRSNINAKVLDTKRKNGTFNTSQPEESIYKLLCKSFGKRNVLRQYSSDLYPFNCDFYLPKFDLYIEYNGSWTHGEEPYNSHKKYHKQMLSIWKNKNNSYYDLAIKTWTIRDPKKRKTAKQNGLRYIEFWNLDQVQHWLDKYGKAKRFSKGML